MQVIRTFNDHTNIIPAAVVNAYKRYNVPGID